MRAFFLATGFWVTWLLAPTSFAALPPAISYHLLEGSYFLDECLICGRPSIQRPVRGNFDLVDVSGDSNLARFVVTNIDFTAVTDPLFRIRGAGVYEVTLRTNPVQRMEAILDVNGETKVFTNKNDFIERLAPMLYLQLIQTQQNLVSFYSLEIVAAPLRDLWFSTRTNLVTTNGGVFAAGDFLSFSGRTVEAEAALIGRLGLMPGSGSRGLDAIFPLGSGEIGFSFQRDEFSETLGPLPHGDWISNGGTVLLTNRALLANFEPQPVLPDYGLDAFFVTTNGDILFSTSTNFVSPRIGELSRGDILSYAVVNGKPTNQLVRTSQQLLARFHPLDSATNYGLDALYVWPSGEIWFSTESPFDDQLFGPVSDGDLLSDQGYLVYRNAELVRFFGARGNPRGYGLDALWIVTDVTASPSLPPRLRIAANAAGDVRLDWTAGGKAFQVEKALNVAGPYLPASIFLATPSFVDSNAVKSKTSSFYRVRQW